TGDPAADGSGGLGAPANHPLGDTRAGRPRPPPPRPRGDRVTPKASARGLFVTGTDTGVGKTLISVALLRLAHRRGLRPIPFKPAETGCDPHPADARALWLAARPPVPETDICLYALRLPAAPAQAAAAEGVHIDLQR